MKTRLWLLMTFLVTGGSLFACGQKAPSFRGSALNPPLAATDFVLTDQHGQPFRLSDQQGKVVLLFFGYTHCPDVCPATLAKWKQVHIALGSDAARVRFVFITVDPERDTPERMQEHLAIFHPDFVGLTGIPEELAAVYRAYGVFWEKVAAQGSALEYTVTHTSSTYVIDRQGLWRLRFTFDTPSADMVHDIQQLLQ